MKQVGITEMSASESCQFKCITDYLLLSASKYPQKIAYGFIENDFEEPKIMTYAALAAKSESVASYLQSKGKSLKTVVVTLPDEEAFISCFYGCLMARSICVPTNISHFNGRYLNRLESIISDSNTDLIITDSSKVSIMQAWLKTSSLTRSICVVGYDEVINFSVAQYSRISLMEDDIAFLQYTSGSTGSPKGVTVTHGNIIHNSCVISETFNIKSTSKIGGWLPLYHDMGLIGHVLQPVYSGAISYIISASKFVRDPLQWLAMISKYQISISGGPNFGYELCVDKIKKSDLDVIDLSSWKVAYNGSEQVYLNTMNKFCDQFNDCGFDKNAFFPCYGMAEATLMISGKTKGQPVTSLTVDYNQFSNGCIKSTDESNNSRNIICVGKAHPSYKVIIINPDSEVSMGENQIGEICVSGLSVSKGYWGNPELTGKVFQFKLPNDETNYLRTGDFGFISNNGFLYITGRKKEIIIIRGKNHYPSDMEVLVQESIEELLNHSGAIFQVDSGTEAKIIFVQEIKRKYIKSKLLKNISNKIQTVLSNNFGLLADDILLVIPATVQKTTSGKVKRLAMREKYLNKTINPLFQLIGNAEQFMDISESNIIKLFRQAIGCPNDKIDPKMKLSQLGMDSIRYLQFLQALEKEYQVDLGDEEQFSEMSLVELDRYLNNKKNTKGQLQHVPNKNIALKHFDLSKNQKALWAVDTVRAGSIPYNISVAFKLLKKIDVKLLTRALNFVAKYNEILKVVFKEKNNILFQKINDLDALTVNVIDTENMSNHEQSNLIKSLSCQKFNLHGSKIFKFFLLAGAESAFDTILVSTHHIIMDYYSLELFIEYLFSVYNQLTNDADEKTISQCFNFPSYFDFITYEKEVINSTLASNAVKFFNKKLLDFSHEIDFPVDKPFRMVHKKSHTWKFEVNINYDDSETIRKLAKKLDVTPYVVFVSVYQLLISSVAKQDKFILMTPTLGRPNYQYMNTIGNFANPFLIFSEVNKKINFEQFVLEVDQLLKDSSRFKSIPYSWLVDKLNFDRNSSRSPLTQASFVWHASSRSLPSELELIDTDNFHDSPEEITLFVRNGGSFHITFLCDGNLFLEESAKIIFDLHQRILSQVVANINCNSQGSLNYIFNESLNKLYKKPYINKYIDDVLCKHSNVDDSCSVDEKDNSASVAKVSYCRFSKKIDTKLIYEYLSEYLAPQFIPDYIVPVSNFLYKNDKIDLSSLVTVGKLNSRTITEFKNKIHDTVEKYFVDFELDYLPQSLMPTCKFNHELVTSSTLEQKGKNIALIEGGKVAPSDDINLIDAFLRTVYLYPEKEIIFFINRQCAANKMSYLQLFESAKIVLQNLRSNNFKDHQYIILQLNSLEHYFPIFWGCILGGYIPITIAPVVKFAPDDMVYQKLYHTADLIDDSVIIASQGIFDNLLENDIFDLDRRIFNCLDIVDGGAEDVEINSNHASEVAFCQLSSGSTGNSKVIQIKHDSILQFIKSTTQVNQYCSNDISTNWLPMDHVVPLLTFHIKDTIIGATQLQIPSSLVLSDPLIWLELLDKFKATHTWAPNFAYKLVNDAIKIRPNFACDLSQMKFFMNAGEQTTSTVINDFLNNVNQYGCSNSVMQTAYGMAEMCTILVSVNDYNNRRHEIELSQYQVGKSIALSQENDSVKFISQGKVYPGVSIRITDFNNSVMNQGQVGRIQVKGNTMTLGYYKNPEANTESFLKDGWYNTGDLGFIHNDELYVSGREKELIIINGANFYAYELEEVVSRVNGVLPTFVSACGVLDESIGTEKLVIFYCKDSHVDASSGAIERGIKERLSKYVGLTVGEMILLDQESFKKTTSGKIKRNEMKNDYLNHSSRNEKKFFKNDEITFISDWREYQPNKSYQFVFSEEILLVSFLSNADNDLFLNEELTSKYPNVEVVFLNSTSDVKPVLFSKAIPTYDRVVFLDSIKSTCPTSMGEEVSNSFKDKISDLITFFGILRASINNLKNFSYNFFIEKSVVVTSNDDLDYENSLFPSAIKSFAEELELSACKVVDFLSNDLPTSKNLFSDIFDSSGNWLIAYRNGKRYVPCIKSLKKSPESKLKRYDVSRGAIVVVGGFGGIGSVILRNILKTTPSPILVIGKSERSNDAAPDCFKEFIYSGRIEYKCLDLIDLNEFVKGIDQFKIKHGELSLIINASGQLDYHGVSELDADKFISSINLKFIGTQSIQEVLSQNKKTTFINFTSVNGFYPGSLVASYSAANAFCHQQQKFLANKGYSAYSIAWSFWEGVGLAKNFKEFEKQFAIQKGFLQISEGVGVDAFETIQQLSSNTYLVGLNPYNNCIANMVNEQPSLIHGVSIKCKNIYDKNEVLQSIGNGEIFRDQFGNSIPWRVVLSTNNNVKVKLNSSASSPVPLVANKLIMQIKNIWLSVLNIDEVSVDSNFFEIGGNSIQAVSIVEKLKLIIEDEIDIVELFNYPTIRLLSEYITTLVDSREIPNNPGLKNGVEIKEIISDDSRNKRNKRLKLLEISE